MMPCALMSAESDESAMLTVSLAQKRRTTVRSLASRSTGRAPERLVGVALFDQDR